MLEPSARAMTAITVPGSVTVPANGSTTLTVTVSAAQGTTVQGWINLDGAGANDLHFAYYATVVSVRIGNR